MTYLRKFLPKEANDVFKLCGTDSYQALQLLHLKFHPVHFRYQTDQCKTVPVQGNLSIAAYSSNYMWCVINQTLILNQKNDIGDDFTEDKFISNMKRCDDVRSIVTLERKSPDQYIVNRCKEKKIINSMSALYNTLLATINANDWAFSGQSHTNVHSVVPYDIENNDDDWNSPPEYDYCYPWWVDFGDVQYRVDAFCAFPAHGSYYKIIIVNMIIVVQVPILILGPINL